MLYSWGWFCTQSQSSSCSSLLIALVLADLALAAGAGFSLFFFFGGGGGGGGDLVLAELSSCGDDSCDSKTSPAGGGGGEGEGIRGFTVSFVFFPPPPPRFLGGIMLIYICVDKTSMCACRKTMSMCDRYVGDQLFIPLSQARATVLAPPLFLSHHRLIVVAKPSQHQRNTIASIATPTQHTRCYPYHCLNSISNNRGTVSLLTQLCLHLSQQCRHAVRWGVCDFEFRAENDQFHKAISTDSQPCHNNIATGTLNFMKSHSPCTISIFPNLNKVSTASLSM